MDTPEEQSLRDSISSMPIFQRIAKFQSSESFAVHTRLLLMGAGCLAFFFPKVYVDVANTTGDLLDVHPTLRRAFAGSVYPAAAVNMARRGVSRLHRDGTNAPGAPCAITSAGHYDHTKGGHLILFELKLLIEFPVGSTILVPSGGISHANTDIQEGEIRHAIIQYIAGGLARWIAYGFKTWPELTVAEKAKELAQRASRWAKVLSRFSTSALLPADREEFNARLFSSK
jgi:hypothetical protein